MNLGERLKQLRLENKWNLDHLSKETGFSIAYISKVENGDRIPTGAFIVVMGAVFLTSYKNLLRLAVVSRMDKEASLLKDDNQWSEARRIMMEPVCKLKN